MKKPAIRLLANLARAGGTLVGRCLGAMNNIVLLSEIHPLGTHIFNPAAQALDWYSLLTPEEANRQDSFSDAIRLIEERCRASGRTLVIRDWAHLDYIGVPFLETPVYRNQLEASLDGQFDTLQYSLVRHPADQWLSTMRLAAVQGHLGLDAFLAGYRRFAEQAAITGFMRYEDFTREPLAQMKQLCRQLQLDFDAGFINTWQSNNHVTGDISGLSRGSGLDGIRPLQRRPVDGKLLEKLLGNSDYTRAVELLGYEERA